MVNGVAPPPWAKAMRNPGNRSSTPPIMTEHMAVAVSAGIPIVSVALRGKKYDFGEAQHVAPTALALARKTAHGSARLPLPLARIFFMDSLEP